MAMPRRIMADTRQLITRRAITVTDTGGRFVQPMPITVVRCIAVGVRITAGTVIGTIGAGITTAVITVTGTTVTGITVTGITVTGVTGVAGKMVGRSPRLAFSLGEAWMLFRDAAMRVFPGEVETGSP